MSVYSLQTGSFTDLLTRSISAATAVGVNPPSKYLFERYIVEIDSKIDGQKEKLILKVRVFTEKALKDTSLSHLRTIVSHMGYLILVDQSQAKASIQGKAKQESQLIVPTLRMPSSLYKLISSKHKSLKGYYTESASKSAVNDSDVNSLNVPETDGFVRAQVVIFYENNSNDIKHIIYEQCRVEEMNEKYDPKIDAENAGSSDANELDTFLKQIILDKEQEAKQEISKTAASGIAAPIIRVKQEANPPAGTTQDCCCTIM